MKEFTQKSVPPGVAETAQGPGMVPSAAEQAQAEKAPPYLGTHGARTLCMGIVEGLG